MQPNQGTPSRAAGRFVRPLRPAALALGALSAAFAHADARADGCEPCPISPTMSLMNVALGTELVEFLQGSESAEQALEDVEAAYLSAARTGGFLD